MNVSAEIYVVVALAFAVFSAVTAIGSALILGIGYERLRTGLEKVKENLGIVAKQTGFFATAINSLDTRVDELDAKSDKLMEHSIVERDRAETMIEHAENVMQEASEIAQQITASTEDLPREADLNSIGSVSQLKPAEVDENHISNDDQSYDLQVPHFYPVDEENQIRYM